MMACQIGHIQIVELLLKEQVDPNVQKNDGRNALMLACLNGHTQILELLLRKQVINDLNISNKDGLTYLMITCFKETDNSKIVQLLLEAGADPNIQVRSLSIPFLNGFTALMMASGHGHIQTIELLLEAGADPNIQVQSLSIPFLNGFTALIMASGHGHMQAVRLLLKAGADPNKATATAVTLAQYEIVDELIKAGVSTNISSFNPIINTTINCTVTQCCVMAIAMKNTPVIKMNEMMQDLVQTIKLQDSAVGSVMDMGLQQMRALDETKQIKTLQLLLEVTPQPEDDPYSLIAAAQAGCTPAVELLLKAGYDPLALCSSSKLCNDILKSTPVRPTGDCNTFTIACQQEHIEIVKLMLQRPVDLNATQDNVLTPLMAACTAKEDNLEIVRLLLKAGADPNVKFQSSEKSRRSGDTALTMAIVCNKTKELIQLLLEKGADLNVQSESDNPLLNGWAPLMVASSHDNLEIVQLLLKAGADPNIKSKNGSTALACAVCSGQKTIVQELLKFGDATTNSIRIELNEAGASLEMSIIHLCVSKLMQESQFSNYKDSQPTLTNFFASKLEITTDQFVERVKEFISKTTLDDIIEILHLLLEATPQPEDDPASLIMASTIGNVQAVDLLLKAGYNPKAPLSSSKYFLAILSIIMEHAPLPKEMLEISCPSLVVACIEGHLEVVKSLLKEINDPNHQQETGETFLMLACECGHKDIVLTLLENGADPNICDNDGDNALHCVLYFSSSEDNNIDNIIQTLLSWNINVNAQNNNGVTPLMIASAKGYTVVLLLLLDKADLSISDSKGRTALMHASSNGQSEAVEHLLMIYIADPSVTDSYGSTALCHAAYGGYAEAINVLFNNYNPNQEEIEKAFTAACYGGHKDTIEFLADKINLTKHQSNLLTACMSDDVEFLNNQTTSDLCTPLIESTGLTPLMIAASCGSDGVVRALLLVYGADVNQQDNYLKHSPLMYAISGSRSISIAQHLLDSGANVNAISKDEKTPLGIARDKELNEIAQILENYGGVIYPSVTVEKVEQLSTRQKAELLLGLLMTFSQLHTLPTTASMRESFQVPSFTSVPILSTIMV
ncbi:PREDICTED: ankyrin-1-like [Amphimedon queenslandica]|nr:PREDICTED: ankyrin-1-like [Amphimedon queenslandica]|eukprot:XP_019857636.1 PREDICTED: ankyrin-1-like [Amphimedon queenslandica]